METTKATGIEAAASGQRERVLRFLMTGQQLTQIEALRDLGIMRLASRIDELRKAGHNI